MRSLSAPILSGSILRPRYISKIIMILYVVSIVCILYVGIFTGVAGGSIFRGYVKYKSYKQAMTDLEQVDETAQKEKESEAQRYEDILSELDVYRKQVEQVRKDNEDLLDFSVKPLTYNFDKELTDKDAKQSAISKSLSSILPNVFTWVFDVSSQEQNEANVDIMVSVNKAAELQMLYAVSDINHIVDAMNAQVDMYASFWDTQDLTEQFSNLQVLQEITAKKPIDNSLLDENRQELFKKLDNYYYTLKSVCDMYEFVLTDSTSNREYVSDLESNLVSIDNLFKKYGQTLELHMEECNPLIKPQLVELKDVIENIRTKNAVLTSIPIANQGFENYARSGGGARVHYYYKDMENGRTIVYIQENNVATRGESKMIYTIDGEPIYVEVNGEYAYFFQGQVVESGTKRDPMELYEAAEWLYLHHDSMTNDEYFAHSLLG